MTCVKIKLVAHTKRGVPCKSSDPPWRTFTSIWRMSPAVLIKSGSRNTYKNMRTLGMTQIKMRGKTGKCKKWVFFDGGWVWDNNSENGRRAATWEGGKTKNVPHFSIPIWNRGKQKIEIKKTTNPTKYSAALTLLVEGAVATAHQSSPQKKIRLCGKI